MTRHQYLHALEWQDNGDIVLRHCLGIMNASDDLTKALGLVLHTRHAPRSMGHYKMGSPESLNVVYSFPYARIETN